MPIPSYRLSRTRELEVRVDVGQKRKADQVDPETSQERKRLGSFAHLPGHDEESLCDGCKRIDLETVFNSRDQLGKSGFIVADLGYRTSLWEKSTCPLCRLFAAVRVQPDEKLEPRPTKYFLRAVSFLKSMSEMAEKTKAVRDTDTVCLAVLPGKGLSKLPRDFGYPVISSSSDISSAFRARALRPDRLDYRLLQEWFEYCQ
ncbi:hypothetical protein MMC28_007652 [Mycoblastus sanguinarius]|nr:hypothetical protein [Mycoblastus sanguinarius]